MIVDVNPQDFRVNLKRSRVAETESIHGVAGQVQVKCLEARGHG